MNSKQWHGLQIQNLFIPKLPFLMQNSVRIWELWEILRRCPVNSNKRITTIAWFLHFRCVCGGGGGVSLWRIFFSESWTSLEDGYLWRWCFSHKLFASPPSPCCLVTNIQSSQTRKGPGILGQSSSPFGKQQEPDAVTAPCLEIVWRGHGAS